MTVVAIGTLGTNNYTEVKYRFSDGQVIASSYPIHALIQRKQLRLDQTVILLTAEARKKNWELMELFLKDHPSAGEVRDVSIKDGRNESELWEIFEAITQTIPENAELYIDITHGLRHLPMLLVMACAYLRTAKNVTVKSISYGAFDLGIRNDKNIVVECEVFELLPFVALFDWANATSAFQRTGDASVLAYLLRNTGAGVSLEVKEKVEQMADRLDRVTLALDLARPEEAMQEAESLLQELEANASHMRQYAKPFALLRGLVEKTFSRIRLPDTGIKSLGDRLSTQRRMIDWYMQRRRVALASLLAREWFISRYMQGQGNNAVNDYDARERATAALNRTPERDARPADKKWYRIWRELGLRDVRNDIAHAGQSEERPLSASRIEDKVAAIVSELDNLDGKRF
jgi:CRISPR-associated Csx2 family protein